MMFCLPVACRASLIDASTASAPEFQTGCMLTVSRELSTTWSPSGKKRTEERVERLVRHDGEELLDQLQVRLVVAEVDLQVGAYIISGRSASEENPSETHLAVDEGADLLLRGLGDAWVAVAEVRHTDCGRGGVIDFSRVRRAGRYAPDSRNGDEGAVRD